MAAVASVLVSNSDATNLSLIGGDLSGIQKFIYTISSDGALKSLRARSFYLELVTEEVVQQILTALTIPRTNVIYAGGGNLYILAPAGEKTCDAIKQVREKINDWLLDEFQSKVFLALANHEFKKEDISNNNFAKHWTQTTKKLAEIKAQKFKDKITSLLTLKDAHTPCKVCHRDDVPEDKLKPLNKKEPDSPLACSTCRQMFELGGNLLKVKAIVRSPNKITGSLYTLPIEIAGTKHYYHLFKSCKTITEYPNLVLLVNDWNIEHYKFSQLQKSYSSAFRKLWTGKRNSRKKH